MTTPIYKYRYSKALRIELLGFKLIEQFAARTLDFKAATANSQQLKTIFATMFHFSQIPCR